MKTKILSLFLAVAALTGLVSCNDDNWEPGKTAASEGSLSLGSMSVDVDDAETVVSRAGVSTDAFLVDIITKSNGNVYRSYTYGSMPEVISLPAGDYTVSVRSHNVKDAEWEAPYYVGQSDFSIESGKITEIGTVKCAFSNIKVTVTYTKELLSYLGDDARVRVIANDRGELEYTATETRAGYFAAVDGSTTLVAEFTAIIKDNPTQTIKTFTDVKPGKHYIISFSVKNGNPPVPDESGFITASGINIDADIEHENVNSSAPAGDDNQPSDTKRPGDEHWEDDPTPPGPDIPGPTTDDAITFKTKDNADILAPKINVVKEGDDTPYELTIKAVNGIENLRVNIETTNDGFKSAVSELMPMSFDLAHLELEAADYPTLKDDLKSINLIGDEPVLGSKEAPFAITDLVSLLSSFSGTHKFTITVTDQAVPAHEKSTSLIFKVD